MHRPRPIFLLFALLLPLIGAITPLSAQDEPANTDGKNLEALRSTLPLIQREEASLQTLRERLKETASDVEREKLEAEIAAVRNRIDELRDNFRTLASGVDEDVYFDEPEKSTTINDQVQEIVQPLLDELRDATSAPREMEQLRDALGEARERRELAENAVGRLEDLLRDEGLGEAIAAQVRETRDLWQERLDEAVGRIAVIEAKIAERDRNTPTILESVSNGLSSFWKSRGLNLLLAVAAFIVTFLLLRRLYRLFQRISPFHRKGEPRFTARLINLLAVGVAVIVAIAAALVVFYLRGDWLLLTVSAIILAGIVIASRNSLPPYIDQIRTILNLGPVREGERLVHDGVPWRVDRLGVYCRFSNPLLGGGTLRLPIRVVNDLYSRPCDKKEPWFPTKENDWVILGDETYGKVIHQTPERVTVLRLGGSRKTYPTADFLSLSPENLSTGFRVSSVFGIDYAHQEICTGDVPTIFSARLEKELIDKFGHEVLHNLNVEFSAAGASSLDYTVLADFTGEAASRYNAIQRLLQKLCVDVCNERGWTIPFTQITVHQADPAITVDATGERS